MVMDGVREDYSVTELKSRVLSMLGFNEKVHPQASSLIYRYAVFTPQEKMKEILSSNEDERLETIRRAFMMEDYKTAVSNSEDVQKYLRTEIRAAEMSVADLQMLKEGVRKYEIERSELQTDISRIMARLDEEKKQLSIVSESIDGLRKLREKHATLSAEIDSLSRIMLTEEKNMNTLSQKSILSDSRMDITKEKMKMLGDKKSYMASEIKNLMFILGIGYESALNIDEPAVNDAMKNVKACLENSIEEITKTKLKIQDLEKLVEKGVCPLCEQTINPDHFNDKISGHSSALKTAEKLLEDSRKLEIASNMLASLLSDMKNADKESELFAQSYAEEAERKKEFSTDTEKSIKSISESSKKKEILTAEINGLGIEIGKIADLENKEKTHRRTLDELSRLQAARNQRLVDTKSSMERDSERIKQMESKLNDIKTAKESLDWLKSYFIPSVESVERHVFASYNRDFDSLFKKWFSTLMDSGEISVRVDDKFTPVVEQNGYEQDVDALSGGEKTSVALAYRLALNTIVKDIAVSLKNNLLILDEPTDGFSKEQLHRMRDILNELQCDQVIIVSHEKELEAFVDSVIEVRKEGSVSRIISR